MEGLDNLIDGEVIEFLQLIDHFKKSESLRKEIQNTKKVENSTIEKAKELKTLESNIYSLGPDELFPMIIKYIDYIDIRLRKERDKSFDLGYERAESSYKIEGSIKVSNNQRMKSFALSLKDCLTQSRISESIKEELTDEIDYLVNVHQSY